MSASGGLPAHLGNRLPRYLPATLIFVIALAARTALVVRSAGFDAWPGYDETVYYAASSSLLHGRIPYHDFVLLHPPVVMLALLPATVVGHLTSDHVGFITADVGFSVIGALNAVLVSMVVRRLGLSARAGMVGGLLYAIWFAPAVAEYSARLEPLGNFFLLLGLLALATALDPAGVRGRRHFVAAGALFATAASTKIWFAVPLIVALGWVLLVQRRRNDAALMALGAVAAGVVIDVPFLIASRGEMWSMVVTAQLERIPRASHPYVVRIADLTTAYFPRPDTVTPGIVFSAVIGMAVLIAVLVLAWRVPTARLVVALATAALLTLLLSPAWFEPYADFSAAPVAVCAAAAAQAVPTRFRAIGWVPVVCSAGVTLAVLAQGYPAMYSWGPKEMTIAARHARCVTSDSPAGLIALDVLDRDLHNGCAVWVDPIGRGYLDSHQAGSTLATNPAWQRQVVAYLRTGELAYPYLLRTPLDRRSKAKIARYGAVIRVRADGRSFVLYRQSPGANRDSTHSTR